MGIPLDTSWIVDRAKALGFDLCGVTAIRQFPELERAAEWLSRGYAGEMSYLQDHRRANPQSVLPGIQSAIVCALNYNTNYPQSIEAMREPARGWISRYAWGDDYHEVLWEKLNHLVAELQSRSGPDFEARAFADTGPINERILARYAGLGWIGKNTLLLNQTLGSWFFLGVILTNADLAPTVRAESPLPPDLCGTCTRCIDACPTQALIEPYVLDARRCISYLTIELRGAIPESLRAPMGLHVFGCDICQDVCPWNRRAPVTNMPEFQPRQVCNDNSSEVGKKTLFHPLLEWLARLTQEDFRRVFRGSAIKRTKWRGLVRNACIALGNAAAVRDSASAQRIRELLGRLAADPDSVISESARWALSRIQHSGDEDARQKASIERPIG